MTKLVWSLKGSEEKHKRHLPSSKTLRREKRREERAKKKKTVVVVVSLSLPSSLPFFGRRTFWTTKERERGH